MVYFENPDDCEQVVSWNGKDSFHLGYVDAGTFVPTDHWIQASEYYLGREVPMTADKAMKIAKERFNTNKEEE
jgi:hypothetical protein